MYSIQPSQQSLYHTQANAFPSQPKSTNNWTKVSYKPVRSSHDEIETKTEHSKGSDYILNQPSTSNFYTAQLDEKREDQQHKTCPVNMPKPPPMYINGIKNISPLINLLQQIAKQQYEIKALAENQVKVQSKISECYGTAVKTSVEKQREFHTYKLEEEISYKVVLKISTTPSTLRKSKPKLRN
jgi:hypothetical protein